MKKVDRGLHFDKIHAEKEHQELMCITKHIMLLEKRREYLKMHIQLYREQGLL